MRNFLTSFFLLEVQYPNRNLSARKHSSTADKCWFTLVCWRTERRSGFCFVLESGKGYISVKAKPFSKEVVLPFVPSEEE